MTRIWTAAQTAAMETQGRTLLISAAAGSGKTATLTERIIRRLTDPEHPAKLSRMLIVTFTRAAAAELRERIAQALSQASAEDPGNRHLQRQLIDMGGARICTIDSFVREPVKMHFAELGLPATTRMADDAELAPLRERVMGEVIDELYIRYATAPSGELFSLLDNNAFADLCDSLTSSKNDEALIPILLSLYEKTLSFPEGIDRLAMEADELEITADQDFFQSAHGGMIREWMNDFCASALPKLEYACRLIASDEAATRAYGRAFEADLAFMHRVSEVETYAEAYELFSSYQSISLTALRNSTAEFVACKETRTEITKAIKSIAVKYFIDTPDEVTRQMRETARMCRALHTCLKRYDSRILDEKKTRGICDFTDNRRYLLSLLRGTGSEFSPLAAELRTQFDEVYIDEYQDVDELQDEIFRLVGGSHRFMVGDIKQSIYGFRGADPSVFARYRRELSKLSDSDDPENGNSIFMSDNFRCDESVIRVTNAVCGHIFRACPDSVGYQPEDDLGFAKSPPTVDYSAPTVEVAVLTKPPKKKGETDRLDAPDADGEDLAGLTAEATYVANEIASLLRARTPLANGTPIRPGDIAILMRTTRAMPAYMSALTTLGIPTGSEELDAIEAGRDLLHGGDMMYLVNLLRVIDDPDNDIPLSEILRAPFPGFSLEDVLTIRRVGERESEAMSLYECLEAYPQLPDADRSLADRITDFIHWLEQYRALCALQPADGILRLLKRDERCACTHTDAFLYLYDSARTCRTATFVSLYTFLRYFEKKILTDSGIRPKAVAEEGGHVSLMTIHKSKGLEFPVCFVVRCGQTFSNRSITPDLIFEKRTGAGMKLYRRATDNSSVSCKIDTTLRAATALATRISEREEEMRVLYVAMTRARERLYVIGEGSEKVVNIDEGDRYATLSASCYLRWVLAGLSAHPEVSNHCRLHYIFTSDITPDEQLSLSRGRKETDDTDPVAVHYRSVSMRHSEPDRMDVLLRHIPTKVPASRMRQGMLDSCVFYDTDRIPDATDKLPVGEEANGETWCDAQSISAVREALRLMASEGVDEFELLLNENRRPTPAERGTAIHLFLQYCRYERMRTAGIEEELSRLLAEGFLNERTVQILDRSRLTAFFGGSFFARISDATHIEREVRFSRFVPLSTLTSNAALAEALGDRTLYVQGSIDLLCEFADGHLEICDYKTDRITDAERADRSLLTTHMQERHGEQLAQYTAAVSEMYGRRPTHVWIYSVPLGEAIEIPII